MNTKTEVFEFGEFKIYKFPSLLDPDTFCPCTSYKISWPIKISGFDGERGHNFVEEITREDKLTEEEFQQLIVKLRELFVKE